MSRIQAQYVQLGINVCIKVRAQCVTKIRAQIVMRVSI